MSAPDPKLALASLYALRAQLDVAIALLEGVAPDVGPQVAGCEHPEDLRVFGNFGEPESCGVCGMTL